jgi:hypothetical protein
MKSLLFILALLCSILPAWATNNVWSSLASTDYSVAANWSLGHIPTTGEVAYFDGTSVVNCTLSADITPPAITEMSAYTGTIAFGTRNCACSGDVTFGGLVTIGESSGTGLTCVNLTIGAGGLVTSSGLSIVTISGNYDQSSTTSKFAASTSTITVNGNGTVAANGTVLSSQYNSATLVLNGTNTLTYGNIGSTYVNGFNNLVCGQSDGVTTVASVINIRTTLTIGTGTLSVANSIRFSGNTPFSFDAASRVVGAGYLNLNGVNQTIPFLANGFSCDSLRITSTCTQTGNVVLSGGTSRLILCMMAATDIATWNTDGYNLTVQGNLQFGVGADTGLKTLNATHNGARTSTITVGGNWLNYGTGSAPSRFIADNSTVIFNAASGTQTLTSGSSINPNPFNNLIHSGAGTLQLLDNCNVTGQWLNAAIFYNQVTVTGTLSPDATGTYTVAGVSSGFPYYSNGTYVLFNLNNPSQWILALNTYLGNLGDYHCWYSTTPAITTLNPYLGYTGIATVANVTSSGWYSPYVAGAAGPFSPNGKTLSANMAGF